MKLITCLRHPVERMFSHYLYLIRSGRTRLSFEEAVNQFPELIGNSMYAKHLAVYFKMFPKDNIKVLYFDNLKNDSRAFAAELFDFLKVSFPHDLPYEQKILSASKPRSYVIAKFFKASAKMARYIGFSRLVGQIKRNPVALWFYIPYRKDTRPSLQPETRIDMQKYFKKDQQELEKLLNVDLSHWYN